jgi:radical SAM protein with 4Fe4S-binding SPASM domain
MSEALRPPSEILNSEGKVQYPTVPQTVCFEPLYGCNIRCSYCYIGETDNVDSPSVPPLELTLKLLRTIKHEGVREVYLAGGEPLSHPRFTQICVEIANLNFEHRGVVTNGMMVTRDLAERLKQLDFWVNISFRGPTPEMFDEITRSKGSFRGALRGLHILSSVGIRPAVEIDLIPLNFNRLYDIISMLLQEGIPLREVWLHRIAPFGDAAKSQDVQIALEQYREVFSQAKRIKDDFNVDAIYEDGFPLCLLDKEFWTYTIPCACGITSATIDPFGNFRRCACHPKQYGNILEASLRKLWSQALEEFRSLAWLSPACKECTLLSRCGGGCSVTLHSTIGHAVDHFSQHAQLCYVM